jgi:hypothetical protein
MVPQPTFESLAHSLELPGGEVARLREVARQRGITPLGLLREVLSAGLRMLSPSDPRTPQQPSAKTPYQILNELGAIGGAKGLPADLSTNPEHMEGFGRHDN